MTEIDLPILPSWRASHPIRVQVDSGRVSYEKLEDGIGKLAGAVLDFHVKDGALLLDKDVPLVPFDRSTLLRWPLPEAERFAASKGMIRLARLAQPAVEVKPKHDSGSGGARYLEEVSANSIDVSLSVGAKKEFQLPTGGALRFGRTRTEEQEGSDTARSIDVSGHVVHRPDDKETGGQLKVRFFDLDLGLLQVRAGGSLISGDVLCNEADIRVGFLDLTPSSVKVTLREFIGHSLSF